jgi:hypothetical protein
VDGHAHQRSLHHRAALERAIEVGEGEPYEARPQTDVGRRRVLGLDATDAFERTKDRQRRALEQKLPRQERAVQLPRRELLMGRRPP